MNVPIWGWSKPGTTITVTFAGQTKTATAGADGKWVVQLDPLKASNTPRDMIISENPGNTRTLKNILVGEVWMASGQSNMQWKSGKSSSSWLVRKLLAETEGKVAPIREFEVTSVNAQLHRASGLWRNDR